MHDPRFNRLLRDDVDHVFERYKALPGPLADDSLVLYHQIQDEIVARLEVRSFP